MKILFFDVDGAPFLAYEMAALQARGHDVFLAGVREFPDALLRGEFAALSGRVLRFRWLDGAGLRAAARFLARRPGVTLAAVLGAGAAQAGDLRAFAKWLATLGWTFSIARWAEEHGVEHLHGNWAHLPATSAWMVSRLTGIPYSFSGHAGRDLFRTTAMLGRKLADARFAAVCNEAARRQLLGQGGGGAAAVHLCYHGIDLARFRPGESPPSPGEILCVGTLDPAKGFDVAVRALAALRGDGVPARLRLVGEGPERERLRSLAADLGVTADLDLAGRLENDALIDAYRRASVFLMPSRLLSNGARDGLPNVVVEAMAMGLPVVGSDVAGIPEAVEDGRTGLLVCADDPRALAAAARRLLEDRPLAERLAAAAQRRVAESFDRNRCVERLAALFATP